MHRVIGGSHAWHPSGNMVMAPPPQGSIYYSVRASKSQEIKHPKFFMPPSRPLSGSEGGSKQFGAAGSNANVTTGTVVRTQTESCSGRGEEDVNGEGGHARTSSQLLRWGSYVSRLPSMELAAREAVMKILDSIGQVGLAPELMLNLNKYKTTF
jgi:hypothetical protein